MYTYICIYEKKKHHGDANSKSDKEPKILITAVRSNFLVILASPLFYIPDKLQ